MESKKSDPIFMNFKKIYELKEIYPIMSLINISADFIFGKVFFKVLKIDF